MSRPTGHNIQSLVRSPPRSTAYSSSPDHNGSNDREENDDGGGSGAYYFLSEPSISEDGAGSWSEQTSPGRMGTRGRLHPHAGPFHGHGPHHRSWAGGSSAEGRWSVSPPDLQVPVLSSPPPLGDEDGDGGEAGNTMEDQDTLSPTLNTPPGRSSMLYHDRGAHHGHAALADQEDVYMTPHSAIGSGGMSTPYSARLTGESSSKPAFMSPEPNVDNISAASDNAVLGLGLGDFTSPDAAGNGCGGRGPQHSHQEGGGEDTTPLMKTRKKGMGGDHDAATSTPSKPTPDHPMSSIRSPSRFWKKLGIGKKQRRGGKASGGPPQNESKSRDFGGDGSNQSDKKEAGSSAKPSYIPRTSSGITASDNDHADDEGNPVSSDDDGRKAAHSGGIPLVRPSRGSAGGVPTTTAPTASAAAAAERARAARHRRTRSGDKTAAALMLAGINGGQNDWMGMTRDDLPHPEDHMDEDDDEDDEEENGNIPAMEKKEGDSAGGDIIENDEKAIDKKENKARDVRDRRTEDRMMDSAEKGEGNGSGEATVGTSPFTGRASNHPPRTSQGWNSEDCTYKRSVRRKDSGGSWGAPHISRTPQRVEDSPAGRHAFMQRYNNSYSSVPESPASSFVARPHHEGSDFIDYGEVIERDDHPRQDMPLRRSPTPPTPPCYRGRSSSSESSVFSWISGRSGNRVGSRKSGMTGRSSSCASLTNLSQSDVNSIPEDEGGGSSCSTSDSNPDGRRTPLHGTSDDEGRHRVARRERVPRGRYEGRFQRQPKSGSSSGGGDSDRPDIVDDQGGGGERKSSFKTPRHVAFEKRPSDDGPVRLDSKSGGGMKRSPSKKELAELYCPVKTDYDGDSTVQPGQDYPTFVCPRCKTKQREFFSVKSAPRQFDTPAGYLAVYFGIYVVAGLVIFGLEEGWPMLDCVYFSVITLTTAGLGDLTPSTDGAKVVCSLFIYFGVACIGLLLGSLLASSLDDQSEKLANEQLADSCPNCQRLRLVGRPTIEAVRGGGGGDFSRLRKLGLSERRPPKNPPSELPTAESRTPTKAFGKTFFSERGIFHATVRNAEFTQETPGPGDGDKENSDTNNDRNNERGEMDLYYGSVDNNAEERQRLLRDVLDRAAASNGRNRGARVGSSSSEFSDGPMMFRMESDALSAAEGSVRSTAPPVVNEKSPMLSPTFANLSPTTPMDILNRSTHTRHISLDVVNASQLGLSKDEIAPPTLQTMSRNRKFSHDVHPTVDENAVYVDMGYMQSQPMHRQPMSFEDGVDSSSSSSSSGMSTSADDPLGHLDAFKAARYVFLTLKQAVMNSILIITIGSLGFYFIENLGAVDSFYFTTVLLTTVGYGDITPHTAEGKMFATIYVLVAGTVLLHNMSLISMIPLELRKRRIERAVLTQFGEHLDDIALRELATGPLIRRLQLSADRTDGLNECTREMFSLAMLVRLGRVTERDVRATFEAFRRLDRGNDGKLDSKDIIYGEVERRKKMSVKKPPRQIPRPEYQHHDQMNEGYVFSVEPQNDVSSSPFRDGGSDVSYEEGLMW